MIYNNSINKIIEKIIFITGHTENKKLALHEPNYTNTNAINYVNECINSGWVSSAGKWVEQFEKLICEYTGAKFAIAVSNGTVALRLTMFLVGVRNSEEVLIPPMSFVATANAVCHLGAIPHFIDIEKEHLGMSPKALSERLDKVAIKKNGHIYNKNTGRRIAAIVVVHVFGYPAEIIKIKEIGQIWGIPVIEDAAEALGSWVKNEKSYKHCGLFGKASIFSFNGNKIISTGGGGMLITDDELLAKKAKHLSTTAKIKHPWAFIHDEVGWNDRLPNINSALGVSQMEVLPKRLSLKRKLHEEYCNIFNDIEEVDLINNPRNCSSNHWLVSLKINDKIPINHVKEFRDSVLNLAHQKNILLRPSWELLSSLKMFASNPKGILKNAEHQSNRIINLPSSPQLLDNE